MYAFNVSTRARLPKLAVGVLAAAAVLAGGTVASASRTPTSTPEVGGGCAAYHEHHEYPLQLCDKGSSVRAVQTMLSYFAPGLDVDGHFGVDTEDALIDFAQRFDLPVNVALDHDMWAVLTWQFELGDDLDGSGLVDPWEVAWLPDAPGAPAPAPTPNPTVCPSYRSDYAYPMQLCGRGEAIRIVQLALQEHGDAIDADGYFGPATRAAVRGFQDMQGLAVTGEIDSVTWQVLTGGRLLGADGNANGIIDSWEATDYIPGLPHWGC